MAPYDRMARRELPRTSERTEAANAQVHGQAQGLASALARLAAGETGVRLDGSGGADARDFNLVAQRLDARASEDGPVSLLDPHVLALRAGPAQLAYIAVLGVDGFSRLRTQIGAAFADRLLQSTAERIRAELPGVQLGRIGRTNLEFAFHAPSNGAARAQLESLKACLERRLEIEGQSFDLDMAFGFAGREDCGDAVIECAATALANAQSGSAKVVEFRPEDQTEATARLELLRDLRRAMGQDELFLAYQPKLRTRTATVDTVEALIRWRHPIRGLIPPDDFIGLAEETGLIADLTRWVLDRALADQVRLAAAGHEIGIHINISGRLVADAGFAAWALKAFADRAVGVVGFEITETAVIDDPEVALANLQAFADAGIKISIDDYGSGLSSLAYLKQLPAHELKIDRMFVSGLSSSHRDPLLVRSTIDLAHALEMEVTAEGVDSPIALALLRMMGCDLVQGYLISPPLDLAGLLAFLSAGVQIQIEQPRLLSFARETKV